MIFESVLALALAIPADPELKCAATHHLPGFPEGSAAVVIDGEVRGNNVDFDGSQLSPQDVGRVRACSKQRSIYTSTNWRTELSPASVDLLAPSLDGYGIEAGEFGWALVAPEVTDLLCSVSESGFGAGEDPSCRTVYTAAKRSLWEAWERGQQAF